MTYKGREYLVAPLSLIVPGVLNGSKGPLYYPPEEVGRDPSIWNRIPLVLSHPTDPITNKHLSASHPGVLERSGLGEVRDAHWDGRKLRAYGWFDAEHTRAKAPDVYNALKSGQPVELSTGLFTDNEEKTGDFKGKQFTHIARNYRADHVAILVKENGACSVSDGCGVLVNCGGPGGKPGPCPAGGSSKLDADSAESMTRLAGNLHAGSYLDKSSIKGRIGTDQKVAHAIEHLDGELQKRGLTVKPMQGSAIVKSARGGARMGKASGWKIHKLDSTINGASTMTREQKLEKLTANCSCDKTKATLNGMTEEQLDVMLANASMHGEGCECPKCKKAAPPAANAEVTLSAKDQETLNAARRIVDQQKEALIQKLAANTKSDTSWLKDKSLPELEQMASLLPVATGTAPIYAPGGAETTTNKTAVREVEDAWPPVLNYEELAKRPA